MSFNHDELIQQLENIRARKSTGTLMVTTKGNHCASIAISAGVIVAASYGLQVGTRALASLVGEELLGCIFDQRFVLKVPIAEIDDPAQADRILGLSGLNAPPSPAAGSAAIDIE